MFNVILTYKASSKSAWARRNHLQRKCKQNRVRKEEVKGGRERRAEGREGDRREERERTKMGD